MRLGTRTSHFRPDTQWSKLRGMYGGAEVIEERHRHRYEVNPDYIERLDKAGLVVTAFDDLGVRVESVEIQHHPFFVGYVRLLRLAPGKEKKNPPHADADWHAAYKPIPSSPARC